MIAELGLFFLVWALIAASMLVVVPGLGLTLGRPCWINSAKYYLGFQCLFVVAAYACLSLCFLWDDFSVTYVLNNSSVNLPLFYKLCAVWGGHEGSMLLWVLILSFWMALVGFFSASLDSGMRARVLVVLGALSVGFILFLLATSNPFLRQFQWLNTQGRDLNPLLQDPGFLFHPPMLYMGYVGFSVAFAFAIAALWAGKIETAWCKWTRPWTMAAWCCLTLGITLGSWWAYRELGWGGWWFWDPVENASFMPWLAGTALIHSLMVTEKRQQFKAWTLLLAITTFSLSLVGTFLVRSGVLTSVHAFAVDPQRGMYILGFLLVVIGGSLLLFLIRAKHLEPLDPPFLVSRDVALLLNNVFLVVLMLTVLLGTVYPLIIDGLGLGKLSVGAPYFNAVFVPLFMPLLLLMGLGIHLKWQKDALGLHLKRLGLVGLFSVLIPLIILFTALDGWNIYAFFGLSFASWVILSTLQSLWMRWQRQALFKGQWSYWGMFMAHCGVAITAIGITISSLYGVEEDLTLAPGQQIYIQGYGLHFLNQFTVKGPNYTGTKIRLDLTYPGKHSSIYPEKRFYTVGQMAMTESAIDVNPWRDIYVALGEPLPKGAWSLRFYYKPLVRWIWAGGLLMFIGGLLSIMNGLLNKRRGSV